MKKFTNRRVSQKIIIVLLTVLMLNFSIPKPVNAVGGVLMSPIVTLITTVLDGIQHLLEWTMLGETSSFMKDIGSGEYEEAKEDGIKVDISDMNKYGKIEGSLWGFDDVNIPKIQYTPEEIFANRVPALDINFINPSVTTGNETWDKDHNIAIQLQSVISSWYVAIRTLALVGLLSVLIYLGIRILLTSVAADRAKYKKMIIDWLVAVCLLFMLHYIMSFALTISEVVTSLISTRDGRTISVVGQNSGQVFNFSANLMSFVRFMIQSKEKGLIYFLLYIMLIVYTVKFTWTYLKRVVNMAFLTLIAPFVALTYPIDKVGDGKAQAFDMWIKEFSFNALLQPLHLMLYTILLSSAIEVAVINPLYAIVCLGFIMSAEKLLKSMFGFNKAGAGTVGSLAGAAAVTTLASRALMGGARMLIGGKGGAPGKVRTNDKYQRQGKDNGRSGYRGDGLNLQDVGGTSQPIGESSGENSQHTGGNSGAPSGNEEKLPMSIDEQIAQEKENSAVWKPDSYWEDRRAELENEQANNTKGEPIGDEATQEAIRNLGPEEPIFRNAEPIGPEDPETAGSLFRADVQALKDRMYDKSVARHQRNQNIKQNLKNFATDKDYRQGLMSEAKRKAGVGAYKTIKGVGAGVKTGAYKAARGALKMAVRGTVAAGLGTIGGVIAATGGDAEKALGTAGATAAVGFAAGGAIFEGTVGKKVPDKSIKESLGAVKYGSVTDYRNAISDKNHIKSQEHYEEYEKYFKEGNNRMTKKQYDQAVLQYRQAGITDTKQIRNALKLENKYVGNGADRKLAREDIQKVIQDKDKVSTKSFKGDAKSKQADIEMIERSINDIQDRKLKRERAEALFKIHQDFYEL